MDMEMLEAIKSLLSQQKQEIMGETKALMAQQRKEVAQDMKVLLDTEVQTRFNLLAEGQEDILRRMPNEDDMDIIDGRLHDLETDVALLKKAN